MTGPFFGGSGFEGGNTDLRSLGLDLTRTGKGSVDLTHDERWSLASALKAAALCFWGGRTLGCLATADVEDVGVVVCGKGGEEFSRFSLRAQS